MIFIDDIRLYRSAPPVPVATAPENIGLVAYYTMENDVQDISGNGLDGTLSGGPSFVTGIDGSALSLDGSNDYVDCGDSASFDVTEEVTLSAWVNTTDAGNDEHNPFVGKGDTAYAIKHSDGNSLEFFIYGQDEWHTAYFPVDDSFNGQWHHVAGTYDGSQVKLYVNGGLVGTADYEGPIDINTYPVNIGRNSEATNRLYNGAIDEVRIYNRALSAGEILYLADQHD
jgi:beta-galactosidase